MWDWKMKALFLGMSMATVVGLSAGGVMKPVSGDFDEGPRVMTPLAGRHGPSVAGDAVSWTSYGVNVPDYVIGTDWIAPQIAMIEAAEAQEAEPPPAPQAKAEPAPAPEPPA